VIPILCVLSALKLFVNGLTQGDFVPVSLIIYSNQLNENLDKSLEMVYRGTQY
jgi:hypothetical protein